MKILDWFSKGDKNKIRKGFVVAGIAFLVIVFSLIVIVYQLFKNKSDNAKKKLLNYTVGIAFGIFIFGLSIVIFLFNYIRNVSINKDHKVKEKKFKEVPIWKCLMKKEIILLAKNSEYTFSFTGLLIIHLYTLSGKMFTRIFWLF